VEGHSPEGGEVDFHHRSRDHDYIAIYLLIFLNGNMNILYGLAARVWGM
jgi:hypothetical protein